MQRKLIAAIIGLLFFLNGISQAGLPPVFEIKSDTAKIQVLDSTYWQKLEDTVGKWTFDEVRNNPLSEKFHIQIVSDDKSTADDVHTHWQRYRLKNTMATTYSFSLSSPVDEFDVYAIRSNGNIEHYRSGWLRKWDEKDGLKSAEWAGAISLKLAPGEEITIYDRRYRKLKGISKTSIRLFNTEQLIKSNYIDYVDNRETYFAPSEVQEAFIIGMILISLFISLFFYRVVREKVYLYFALFVFFLGINRFYNIAGSYTQWFRQDLSRYVNYIGLAWAFIPFFLIQFVRSFFEIKKRYPKFDKALFIVGMLNIVATLSQLFPLVLQSNKFNEFFIAPPLIAFLIIPLLLIITSFLFLRNQNSSFRLIALGLLPLICLYIISTFLGDETIFGKWLDVSPRFMKNFRLIEMICLCWLLLCFVKVLVKRYGLLQSENANQAFEKEMIAREIEIERSELIARQKVELEKQVTERTAELQQSLESLKATQSQLIQSEKMASLGELTAGIAHEIQNPLNFINNFSELNKELVEEMKTELANGNLQSANEIADDIISNEEKINYHGKRADAIVKGMLQHSRKSSGQKELIDINALCDEYLRLSYHGLRAKDKSFNAKFETNFDPSLPKINVVPQEMGRVILNLINNAFYAVSERKKLNEPGYEPTVIVSTRKENEMVEIKVKDNGTGISQKVIDKIFQPFFTTKPTGSGTGLGLSLSYDIVTKGHSGELKVETKEGGGSEFVIFLSVQ